VRSLAPNAPLAVVDLTLVGTETTDSNMKRKMVAADDLSEVGRTCRARGYGEYKTRFGKPLSERELAACLLGVRTRGL
jgi:hypothetical protein